MLAYKYRGGDEKILERDISSLKDNYFWSPTMNDLNDPFETLVFSDRFKSELSALQKVFGLNLKHISRVDSQLENLLNKINSLGVYSLSSLWNSSPMWAHYGYSHKGFCVEYDLEVLLKEGTSKICYPPLKIEYLNAPPQLEIADSFDSTIILSKIIRTKSKVWEYENEYRLVTEPTGACFYDSSAVKSIYFGYRMEENYSNRIMEALKGRNIKYYQMILKNRSYDLDRVEVEDKFKNSQPYLLEMWRVKSVEKVGYKILKKKKLLGTETIIKLWIELSAKITQNELEELAYGLKEKLGGGFEKVFISYLVRGEEGSWALSYFYPDKAPELKILGSS
jgi:hypothetical protein